MKNGKYAPLYETREVKDLKDMLDSSTKLFSDRVAYLVKDTPGGEYREIKYKQVKEDVDALGTALLSLGLKDKRIAIIGENRYEWAVSYLAVLNGVGTVVPLDKELPETEIESLLTRANVSAIIYSNRKKEQILNISKRIGFVDYYISMDEEGKNNYEDLIAQGKILIKKGNREFIDAKIDSKEVRIILFTSGTTELSKAVMLTHKNIASNMMCSCKMINITPDDRFFSVLPLHHTYECTAGFLIPLYRGASVAYCEGLRYVAKNMQEAKPTVMLAVPLLFENMYNKVWEGIKKEKKEKVVKAIINISNILLKVGIDIRGKVFKKIHENFGGRLRLGISGAAALDKKTAKGFRELGIHLIQGYGLTECSPLAALNRDIYYNDSAAGREVPGIKLKIDEQNSEGVGEILVKGDNVMMGYYNNEEATKKTLRDGWLYTGDLGYFDKDGFLIITGRKKNVLITKNGKNVYPEEIETLLNHSEIIKECMVYQEDAKDAEDTIIAAVIVPNYELLKQKFGELSPNEIRDKIWEEIKGVNSQLVNYKHIKEFKIREEEFEKTTTMKIKRYLAKEK
jgi:long-chain acyl-CoA synthetase